MTIVKTITLVIMVFILRNQKSHIYSVNDEFITDIGNRDIVGNSIKVSCRLITKVISN